MQEQFEKIISEGRSTAGEKQVNDVQVIRYPREDKPKKGGIGAKKLKADER
jgi:hypothetical protein